MKILSKSNYRVRLNVNMDITDSISFYFNFGNGCYFVLRLKLHFLDKARFFLNEWGKSCDSWLKGERGWNLRSPFAINWKLSGQNKIPKITSFPLTPRLHKTLQTTGQGITWRKRTLWILIRAMNRPKVIVLPKRDFNYKLKLVSNDDC